MQGFARKVAEVYVARGRFYLYFVYNFTVAFQGNVACMDVNEKIFCCEIRKRNFPRIRGKLDVCITSNRRVLKTNIPGIRLDGTL